MLDMLLSSIAPHFCYGCGQAGVILCDGCKKLLLRCRYVQCISCGRTVANGNVCQFHRRPYATVWCCGKREGVMAQILDDYKFRRVRAAAETLSEIIDKTLPDVSSDTVIIPVPTAPKNIRVRGYDHMKLIARQLAWRRGYRVAYPIRRCSNIVQHTTASSRQRKKQARDFFELASPVDPELPYLIIDDIFTTGATITAAASCLRQAGVRRVDIAVIVRHGEP